MRLTPDLLADDLSEAEWVVRALDTPWRDGVFVHHHVPRGYPVYLRLAHRPPEQGRVPAEQLAALNDVLRRPGPNPCWFLFWEGFGGMHPPPDAPRIGTHARSYVLYAADLDVGTVLEGAHGFTRTPSIWWPQDRRWVAANDVDQTTTFLAVRDEADAAALARHPRLEAAVIDVEARTDAGGGP